MIRNLFGGASKCRTIDKVDIFGDSSGVALYQLDGNANDTGGNYHGTETAITYGGGVYERGAVFGTNSYVDTNSFNNLHINDFSISFYMKASSLASTGSLVYTNLIQTRITATNMLWLVGDLNGTTYTKTWSLNTWYHVTLTSTSTTGKLFVDGVEVQSYTYTKSASAVMSLKVGRDTTNSFQFNGSIDQLRIFNRAITATEVATLYAECAPTSTVDNINPFMDGSLKALYQFNGDATDKTGVYNGTATNVTYGTGKFGQCAVFNGTSSTITTTTATNLGLTGDFTIGMHVYPTATASDWRGLFGYSVTSNGDTTNSFIFAMTTGNNIQMIANSIKTTGNIPLILNVWNYVTISRLGNIWRLYVDGKLALTNTQAVTITGTYVYNISPFPSSLSPYAWSGSIDQLRIFNKALTPLEVSSLYNETTPLEEPMYKLVDPFKDGSGKALYRLEGNALDESGNYNLTATGTYSYVNGRFGRAIANSTDGQYLTYPAVSGWNSTSNGAVTMWIYMTSNADTTTGLFDSRTAGGLGAQFNFNDGTNVLKEPNGTAASTNMSLNTWYFFAFSLVRSTNTWTVIQKDVNGTTLNTKTFTFAHSTGGNNNIGCIQNLTNYSFRGYIEQVRFFGRNLITQEIDQLATGENNVL